MPHKALNRIVVRMLFDPEFQEAVYANPRKIMNPLGIPDDLQDSLLQNDRRAWNIDSQRRKRSLQGLMGEFPCSCALALSQTKQLADLDAFFSSSEFHKSVQNRGSMPLAFIQFLENLYRQQRITEKQYPDILQLENHKALARRALIQKPLPLKPNQIVRQQGVSSCALNSQVIASINLIENYLYELSLVPAIALCNDKPNFPELPPPPEDSFFLLFQPRDNDIGMSPVSIVIHDALDHLKKPIASPVFLKVMQQKGLTPQTANDLLDSLIRENLVVRASEAT